MLEDFVPPCSAPLERKALRGEVEDLLQQVTTLESFGDVMGPSAASRAVMEQVRRIAPSSLTIVISGETGSGKEVVARAIHRGSRRAAGPLIAVDCGAMPETLVESALFGHERGAFTGADRRKDGYFRLAEGGTLFLDEISNLPLAMQAKLLRARKSAACTARRHAARRGRRRVVAASNTGSARKFARADPRGLYYRLRST